MSKEDLAFDLVESEALVNIFMDREGFTAEKAGIIITDSPIGHKPIMPGDKVTLWFGRGIGRESFKNKTQAYEKAIALLNKANPKIKPRIEGLDAKKFNRILSKSISFQQLRNAPKGEKENV